MPSPTSRRRSILALAVALVAGALTLVAPMRASADAAASTTFDDAPAGFAAGTTGGAGLTRRVVTSLADSGPGSLRDALTFGGDVQFATGLTGAIDLTTILRVPGSTTVDGRGADITIRGKGLEVRAVTNVIIRNLRFTGAGTAAVPVDSIGIVASNHVWIDHNDLSAGTDGLIDVTAASTAITISWNKLTDHDKNMLLGSAAAGGTPVLGNLTMHHNLIERAYERSPLMRHGRFHLYNNVIASWGGGVRRGYAMKTNCGAQAVVEGNVFRPSLQKTAVGWSIAGCDPSRQPTFVARANDLGGATIDQAPAGPVFDPATYYSAAIEPAGAALEARVRAYAGWQAVSAPGSTTTTGPPSGQLNPTLMRWKPGVIRMSWTAVPGSSEYGWSLRTCSGTTVVLSSTAATTKDQANLAPGCYVGYVRSLVAGTWSAWETSPQFTLVEPTTTTTAPSSNQLQPTLSRYKAGVVRVTWTAVPGATKYGWSLSTCDGVVVVASTTAATVKDQPNVAPGCYVGTVRALVGTTWSAWETSPPFTLVA